jgi:hypothetical protein
VAGFCALYRARITNIVALQGPSSDTLVDDRPGVTELPGLTSDSVLRRTAGVESSRVFRT